MMNIDFIFVFIMNILLFLGEVFLILYFFKINGCKFKDKNICITILSIFLILYVILLLKYENNWYVFFMIPFSYILIFLTDEKNIKKRFLLMLICFSYFLFSNYLIAFIGKKTKTFDLQPFYDEYFGFLLVFIIINFILYMLLKKFKNKIIKIDLLKSIIFIFSCLLLTYIFYSIKMSDYRNSPLLRYVSFWTILRLHLIYLGITALVLYLINYSNSKKIDSQTVSQLNNEISYLKEMIKNQNNSSKEMHDLKNKLYAIKEILKDDPEEGINLIDEICGVIQSNENMKYTTNDSLNALIHNKRKIMTEKNIEFNCESNILEFDGVNSLDLCVAVGNLLDNAIEGCNDPLKNKIQLKINNVNNFINVMVINTCNTINIGLKSNKEETCHGMGLDNVKKIAKIYNGDVQTMQDEKCFKVSLLIQVK